MTRKDENDALDPEMDPEPRSEQGEGISDEDLQALAQAAEEDVAQGEETEASERLMSALEQKTKEAAEAGEKYLRLYADFENYRKRMQRDLADFRRYANEQIAADLLTVADHLGLAIQHAAESGEANQGLLKGVELVHKQLRDVLEKYGILPFKAAGEPFDPAKHDAMMQVESADVPANTVVQVFQEGYLYHDKVLRHARVSVSRRPAGECGKEGTAAGGQASAGHGEGPGEVRGE